MQSSYLHRFLGAERYRSTIFRFFHAIKKSGIEFDAIAYRGQSGALIASPLSLLLNKPLILVRKFDDCHSSYSVEGCSKRGCRYIVVDDLISSGRTVNYIEKKIEWEFSSMKMVAIFVAYTESSYHIRRAIKFYEWECPIFCLSRNRSFNVKKGKKR